jgi:Flp pilus assembly pilin Flp
MMSKTIKRLVSRFRRSEQGSVAVEFAVVFPVFFAVLVAGFEMSMITFRHVLVERGLDMAVREIRLGTGTAPQHDAIKDMICETTNFEDKCKANLRLEMRPANLRSFNALDERPDCTDTPQTTKPVRDFSPGAENQLMMLRACLKYEPIFPTAFLANVLEKDSHGQAKIVVTNAFVQEPN